MLLLRYFFVIFLLHSIAFSSVINESLLKIHATLLPKLSFMDNEFMQKVHNNEISILIYHNKNDYNAALSLKREIEKKYKNGIKNYSIGCNLSEYGHNKAPSATILYLFPSTQEKMQAITSYARQHKQLTFAYSKDDLAYGVLFSLSIGAEVKPVVNLDVMKESNISLRPTLLKIAQRYSYDESAQ